METFLTFFAATAGIVVGLLAIPLVALLLFLAIGPALKVGVVKALDWILLSTVQRRRVDKDPEPEPDVPKTTVDGSLEVPDDMDGHTFFGVGS